MTSTRRDFLVAGATAAGTLVTTNALADRAAPPAPTPPPTAVGAHKIVELPFAPGKLKGISAAMITSHHDNNYAGAVKNLNKVEQEIAKITKDSPGYLVSSLRERDLTYTNSMILHEHYFGNLGGDGKLAGSIDR